MPGTVTGPSETDSLAYCRGEVRRGDHDRYLMSLMVGAGARRAVIALLAFNLELARTQGRAGEALLGEMRLQFWHDAVDEIYRGGPARRHPVARELAAAIACHGLARTPIERILAARRRDLAGGAPASMAELEAFLADTSADLLELAAVAAGGRDDAAIALARDAGIAFGLCGVLRALPFHAARRRLYLPADLLRRHGADVEEIFAGRPSAALGRVAACIARRARERLAPMRRQMPALPPGKRAIPALAALAALDLDRLRAVGHDPFDLRLRSTPLRRLLRIARARLTGRI